MKNFPETWLILAGIVSALLVASVAGFVLQRKADDGARRAAIDNLNARVRSWWLIVATLAAALFAGPKIVIVFFAFVSFAALREFITVTRTRASDHMALFAAFFLVLPAQYALIGMDWYGLFSIYIPVYAFLILPIFAVLRGGIESFLMRTSETQWGLMLCVYCVSYIPALLTLKIRGYENRSAFLIIFLLVVVESSDIFQYVFGKLWGHHNLAPAISPSKTVEGLIGGVLAATLLGSLLWRVTPFTLFQAASIALVISIIGFAGGLVMSAIKRDRGLKHWGCLIEGHGGMLDRMDSLCFAAPIFFHLTRYFFA